APGYGVRLLLANGELLAPLRVLRGIGRRQLRPWGPWRKSARRECRRLSGGLADRWPEVGELGIPHSRNIGMPGISVQRALHRGRRADDAGDACGENRRRPCPWDA